MKKINLTEGKYALVDNEDFVWLNRWKWCCVRGYAKRSVYQKSDKKIRKYKHISMHRTILGKYRLLKKRYEVDHINRDKLDNRKTNLRMVTHQQNQVNKSNQINNTSGFKGVTWHGRDKEWRAQIKINGRETYLGHYDNKIDAAIAYNKFAQEVFGEFAYLNSIKGKEK